MTPHYAWNDRWMNWSCWSRNIALAGMIVFALLPAGLRQTHNVGIHGYWFERSAEFIPSPLMEALVRGRVPGDIILAFGAFAWCWAMLGVYKAVSASR